MIRRIASENMGGADINAYTTELAKGKEVTFNVSQDSRPFIILVDHSTTRNNYPPTGKRGGMEFGREVSESPL
ncbi:MAG: hypothetical protein LBT65_09280 [Synergistaceae bacterium]|jgi:hypothetical protein|nr:hypothetical protein [Synergistaceae bacterium]